MRLLVVLCVLAVTGCGDDDTTGPLDGSVTIDAASPRLDGALDAPSTGTDSGPRRDGSISASCLVADATEENTGPPPEQQPCLVTHAGDLEVNEPDVVLDRYCIEGGSIIIGSGATNLTVRNSEIRSVGFAGGIATTDEDARGLLIEDTLIDCQRGGGASGLAGSNWTGHRLEIRNCENGIDIGSNITLTHSLIHMPLDDGESHDDGVQIYEGSHDVLIECNVIRFPLASSSFQFHTSAGVQNRDMIVRYNTLLGGAYVLRVPGDNPSCAPPSPSCGPWTGLEVYGNRLDLVDPDQEFGLCSGDPDSIEIWGTETGRTADTNGDGAPDDANVVDSTNAVIPSCVGSV